MSILSKYLSSYPVDIESMANDFKIEVKVLDIGANLRGSIQKKEDGNYIIELNSQDTELERRFTLAHEIAHYIYHREKIGNTKLTDNRMYRSFNSNITDRDEHEANEVAMLLLLPPDLVEDFLNDHATCSVEEKRQKVSEAFQIPQVFTKLIID